MTDYWFTPELMPPAISGRRVADALAKVMLYAEKENRGRAIDYKPIYPTRIIPSSLCGPVFLKKVVSGNIR